MPQSNENEALRERLSRLSQASQRINESLDFDTVLQGVLDSARSLTEASYALITTVDQSGQVEDYCVSGLTPGDAQRLWEMPEGPRFFEYLSGLPGPLRVRDFAEHARSMGLPEFAPPAPVSSLIAAPIHHRGESVGSIHVAKSEPGLEFTPEDEETLVMFASQAALVIANARRYREEQRARAGLETLIDTSPVGVLVFDAKTGGLASINREARRIVSGLHLPDGSAEQLLGALTFRRADGREISLAEFPLAQALGTGEMVRAEEIVLQAPDGRSVTALVNATPIRSQEGQVESVVVTMQDLTPLEELERLRAEFLGMVSHELRVPLTSIMGSATALLDPAADLDPAEVRQFHRIILEQANHLRRMIGDLLDVARIETGTLPVAAAATDLAGLVEQARNLFLGGGGRHDLLIELSPDLPPVMADQRRIVQVLANLLSNAARHSGADSPIRVSAVAERFQVAISISDQGQGIAAERHDGPTPPGAAGPEAAGDRRHRADGPHPGAGRRAGDLPVRLRPGRGHRPGLRAGGRRLRGQALLAHRTGGPDRGGPAPAGAAPAGRPDGTPGPGRVDPQLPGTPGLPGRKAGAVYRHRVPAAGRTLPQPGTGGQPRGTAAPGLGLGELRRRPPGARRGEAAPPQAGRLRRQPRLYPHRTPRRLPPGPGRRPGRGRALTGAAPWPGLRLTPANGEWGASSPARSSTALPLPTVPPAAPDRRQLVLPVATTIFAGRDGQASRPPANSCAGHRLCRYTVRVNSIDTHVGSPKGHYVIPISRALLAANSHRTFEVAPMGPRQR